MTVDYRLPFVVHLDLIRVIQATPMWIVNWQTPHLVEGGDDVFVLRGSSRTSLSLALRLRARQQ
jgi:hypothetical protein